MINILQSEASLSKSERVFSTTGLIETNRRMRLTSKHLEQLTLVEENLDTVEKLKLLYSIKCDRLVDSGSENWLQIEVTDLEDCLSDRESVTGLIYSTDDED